MINIYVEVIADLSKLRKVRERVGNLGPVFEGPVSDYVSQYLQEQFDSEGSAHGQKWAPLAKSTIRNRRRAGHGKGGIGVDTGRMWSSLVSAPSPDSIIVITPMSYHRRSTVPYTRYFNRGRQGQPARTIHRRRSPNSVFIRTLTTIINNYLVQGTRAKNKTVIKVTG